MGLSLQEFIGEALSQIVLGIDDAKEKMAESARSNWISPPIQQIGLGQEIHDTDLAVWLTEDVVTKANMVRFDVAVHASKTVEAKGVVEVTLLTVVDAELGAKGRSEDLSISRIKFDIPLIIAEPFAKRPLPMPDERR